MPKPPAVNRTKKQGPLAGPVHSRQQESKIGRLNSTANLTQKVGRQFDNLLIFDLFFNDLDDLIHCFLR